MAGIDEICRKTGKLGAIPQLFGRAKVDRTVRFLDVELEDTLKNAWRNGN